MNYLFFKKTKESICKWFKKTKESISEWTVGKKIYVIAWILTAIFLIITIVFLVIWQNTSLTTEASNSSLLTSEALMQQEAIAIVSFITIIIMAIAIFGTTIESVRAKKRQKSKGL